MKNFVKILALFLSLSPIAFASSDLNCLNSDISTLCVGENYYELVHTGKIEERINLEKKRTIKWSLFCPNSNSGIQRDLYNPAGTDSETPNIYISYMTDSGIIVILEETRDISSIKGGVELVEKYYGEKHEGTYKSDSILYHSNKKVDPHPDIDAPAIDRHEISIREDKMVTKVHLKEAVTDHLIFVNCES